MARRHSRAVSRGARRETEWFSIPWTTTAMAAGGGTLISVLNAAALGVIPFTVIRTHLVVHITSDQVSADEVQMAAIGMAVVSAQASAAGVGSIPTPLTELSSDLWYVHQMLINDWAFITGAGFDGRAGYQYQIDSKAMRKVEDGEDIVIVGEADLALGSGVVVRMGGRMLVKLH